MIGATDSGPWAAARYDDVADLVRGEAIEQAVAASGDQVGLAASARHVGRAPGLLELGIGAAAAYLFDPQSGTQRRDDLRRKLNRSEPDVGTLPVDVLVFDERTPAEMS